MRVAPLALMLLCSLTGGGLAFGSGPRGEVWIPSGQHVPFLAPKDRQGKPVQVGGFFMDAHPVTNRQYLAFVRRESRWRKSNAPGALVDSHYLEMWKGDLSPGSSAPLDSPVTHVSWFAAQDFCESEGKTLPTVTQWEYALDRGSPDRSELTGRILNWYGQPNPAKLPPVGAMKADRSGVAGLVGTIWEWTLDFNSTLIGDESRGEATRGDLMFCGSGSDGARDPSDYASFMRFSYRNSLKAKYTTGNLGFRCVKNGDGAERKSK